MTASIRIVTGSYTHEFPMPTGEAWETHWSPTKDSLDVWCALRQLAPGTVEVECEAGNVSIVPGDASKTKPRMSVDVTVDGVEGVRRFPSDYPIGRSTWRRFTIGRKLEPVFCPDWRQRREKYGPMEMPLPRLGDAQRALVVSQCNASLKAVEAAMGWGGSFVVDDSMDGVLYPYQGWMPHGPADPGGVGGTGIYFSTGWPQNTADLRRAYLLAQTEHDRMRRYYRRETGEAISTEAYPGQTPDIYAYGAPPEALIPNSGGDPLPPQYDAAHLCRGFRRTLQIAEQADSPIAKRSLAGIAGIERLRYSPRGRSAVPGYTPMNLRVLQDAANASPHDGIFGSIAGRQLGWPAFLVAADLKLNGVHGENKVWAEALLKFLDTAVTPTGPIQKAKGASGWPSVPEFACQTFEQVILAFGAAGLAKQTGTDVPIFVHRILENIYGPSTLVPILMYGGSTGPAHYLRTADDKGNPVTRLKDPIGNVGDPAHSEAACALGAALDLKPDTFVERGRLYSHPFPSWQAKADWLSSSSVTRLDWEALYLAQCQR